MPILVRRACEADGGILLALMHELAEFEHYRDRFRVTAQDLLDRGLKADGPQQFVAFVAEHDGVAAGYALVYEIPFTYDLRPTLVLKELYVREHRRGLSVGANLMSAVLEHAKDRRCGRLKWEVLPDNEGAKRFYRRYGGAPDREWENWMLVLVGDSG